MSLFRKPGGGGFLNNVDLRIVGYGFESKEWESDNPKAKNSTYHTLTMRLDVLQDGADDAVQQFLRAGFFYPDTTTISDDGLTLLNEDGEELERPVIDEDSEAGRFLSALIEKGFPESDLSFGNFEAIIGRRIRTIKEVDRDEQIRIGRARLVKKLGPAKGKAASEEDAFEAGKRQDKKDKSKSYNLDFLSVAEVYDADDWTPDSKGKKKTAGKPAKEEKVPAKAGKPSKKAAEPDLDEKAVEVLTAILSEAKNNTVLKTQLTGKIVAYAMENDMEDAERDALRKIISSDKFLATEQGWTFDAKDKKQPVTLGESEGDGDDDE